MRNTVFTPNFFFIAIAIFTPIMSGFFTVFNDSTLWITGGEDSGNYLKSTEFVFVNQPPIEGPNLPFAISGHCMVQTDPNTLFIIGGSLSSSKSSPVHSKSIFTVMKFGLKLSLVCLVCFKMDM